MNELKLGERLQIPRDQHGQPVREWDRKTKAYTARLQWFEVTEATPNGYRLKPVWP